MAQSAGTLTIQVRGDVAGFVRQMQGDLNSSLRGVRLDFRPIESQFGKLANAGGEAFGEVASDAAAAGRDIADEMRDAASDTSRALSGIDLDLGPVEAQFGDVASAGSTAFGSLAADANDAAGGISDTMTQALDDTNKALEGIQFDGRPIEEQVERIADAGTTAFRGLATDAEQAGDDVASAMRDSLDDTNRALAGIHLDSGPIEAELGEIGRAGEAAFRELAMEGNNHLSRLGAEANQTTDKIGAGFSTAGEQAERALREVGDQGERQMDRIEREAKDAGSNMLRNLSLAAVGIGAAFAAISVGRFFLDAAQDAEDLGSAIENTQQIIAATGGTAKLTAQQVRELSRELSLKIGVDSVEVQNAANVLLTFRNVSGQTFKEAMGLAADLSAVLGTDLKGSSLQLGKALNDPIRGITALSRAGVTFDEKQKQMIANFVETGQVAKAQAVILDEVRKEVGGVAEAGVDSTDQLKVAFQDLKREAGSALIGFIDDNAPRMIEILNTLGPVLEAVGGAIAGMFSAALPLIEVFATALRDNIAGVGPLMQPLADVFRAIFDVLPGILPLITQMASTALPILVGIVTELARALQPVLPALLQVAQQALPPIATAAAAVVHALAPVLPILAQVAAQIITGLLPVLPPLSRLLAAVAGVAGGALLAILPPLADATLAVVEALLPLVPLAVELLDAFLPLVPVVAGLAAALIPLVTLVAGPLKSVTQFLADNKEATFALAAAVGALAIAANAAKIATLGYAVVQGVIRAATIAWTAVQWALNVALTANPIGLIIVAIGALVAGIILAWKHSEGFRKVVMAVWKAIKVAASAIAGAFVTAWHAIVDFFKAVGRFFDPQNFTRGLKALPGVLSGLFSRAWHAAVDTVKAGVDAVVRFAKDLPARMLRGLLRLRSILVDLLRAGFDAALTAVGVGIGLILAAIIGLPKLIVAGLSKLARLLADAFKAAWEWVARVTVEAFHAYVEFVRSIPRRTIEALKNLGRILADLFTRAWRAVVEATTKAAAAVIDFVKAFPGRMLNGLRVLSTILSDLFTRIWTRVKDQTVAGATVVLDFVKALPGRIWTALKALPGLVGQAFSAAWNKAREIARNGINAIVDFVRKAPGRIRELAGKFVDAGKSLIRGLFEGLRKVGGFLRDVAGDIVGGIKGALNAVIDKINAGIARVDDKLPFVDLPRIPRLAQGGLTQREGLAALHPRELVLPLEDRRSIALLAKAMAAADASAGRTTSDGPVGQGTPAFDVRVYLGDREIRDVVRVEILESNRDLKRRVRAAAGRRHT